MPADFFASLPPHIVDQLLQGATPEQRAALVAALPGKHEFWRRPEPTLLPVPETTRGYRIRLDLLHVKPPVWRRLEVPGDITLPKLHSVIQAAMGWMDSHLHRFRTGNDCNAAEFLTQFDVDEGDEGMLEDDVRLDQIVAAEGDRLSYDYDFGDGWEHVLRVEKVLDTPPDQPICTGGRLACPPEDSGGPWGYAQLAAWARSDFDESSVPEVFDSAAAGRDWLPPDWHPDVFDPDEVNVLIALQDAEPVAVVEELEAMLTELLMRGNDSLRSLLTQPESHGPIDVDADAAAEMTAAFRVLLEEVGDGVTLTGAGYLKPAVVEQIAVRTGIADWWIGKDNREDLTWPVAQLRAAARSLGLVSVRKGRLTATQAARRCSGDPAALLQHIIGRLPLGKADSFDRHAGLLSLAVVGSEAPVRSWKQKISELLFFSGWREGKASFAPPQPDNPTLDVIGLLAGSSRSGWRVIDASPSVAAAARAAIRA